MSFVLWVAACHVVCAALVGCGEDDEAAETEEPKRVPASVFDAGVPASGEFCSTLVAAECDGDEDCTGGKTCCGVVENGTKYNSLRCEEQCDSAAGGIHFCHPGDTCPDTRTSTDTEVEAPICRRSSLLPAYFAICGAPSSLLPTDFAGEPKAAGKVNCGESFDVRRRPAVLRALGLGCRDRFHHRPRRLLRARRRAV